MSASARSARCLGTGLGGLLASAAGGALVDRLGSRRSCVTGAVLLSAGLSLISVASTPVALAGVLVALGAVDVLADIGMNVQAAQVQRESSGSVIQRFHAAWSVGAVAGAAVASAAAAGGVSLRWHLLVTGAALACTVGVAARHLSAVDDPPAPHPAGGSRRSSVLVLLAAVALAMAVVEGHRGSGRPSSVRTCTAPVLGSPGLGSWPCPPGWSPGASSAMRRPTDSARTG